MHKITLVCTRHDKLGKCNSDELYKIIEKINPELIFEEIPPSYFDKYYINKSRNNLETDIINKYSDAHTIKHIPVDSDDVPPDSFFQDHEYMVKIIEQYDTADILNDKEFHRLLDMLANQPIN